MGSISGAITRAFIIVLWTAMLAGCGGGGGGSSATASVTPPAVTDPAPTPPVADSGEEIIENRLAGSVGDGPIIGATILVFNVSGLKVAEFSSDESATYVASVKEKGSEYPLTMRAEGGTDLVTGSPPDFVMTSAIARPARSSRGNINPHGTLIVEASARIPGGIADNLQVARNTVLARLNFGLDPTVVPDPLETEVSDTNVAVLVKASESLGEMVRRTRDALRASAEISGNEVMAALAADLVDGPVDGRGAPGSNPRIAAVATMASAQVLAESLQNGLYVNGIHAAQLMDEAIGTVRPRVSEAAMTESVAANTEMLSQARLAVDAAWALTESPVLAELHKTLHAVQPGARPADVRGRFPDGWRDALSAAIQTAAFGSEEDVEIVNAIVRNGNGTGSLPSQDAAEIYLPVTGYQVAEGGQISVMVTRTEGAGSGWVDYEYVAGTATPGEDFAATPGRLQFANGQLSATLTATALQDTIAEDPEYFEIHLVAFSDGHELGSDTVASVAVADDDAPVPSSGSATLRWTPPTEREDGSVLDNLAGYRVNYGQDQASLDTVIVLENPGLTSYVVDNLDAGTWYFAVTAFDEEGRESDFSNVGSKMIM
jgi:hypothetical protein